VKVNGQHFKTIWEKPGEPGVFQIIDQRLLPHEFVVCDLRSVDDFAYAIREMQVRGAILIGAAAAFGMVRSALEACRAGDFDQAFSDFARRLKATRPTAVNLAWAVDHVLQAASSGTSTQAKVDRSWQAARQLAAAEEENCRMIGVHGVSLIADLHRKHPGRPVQILTHCNAGWLACPDYGTATAPIYAAHDQGIPVHVWVDETRPWNQGSRLTAWELGQHGVPHTVVADNTGGHLMQHGMVDMAIVGSDRTTRTGDVANKIGTYLKALAARDNEVPFYVALPSSTFDWSMRDGVREIPIEERDPDEVKYLAARDGGQLRKMLLTPENSPASNYSFDVTPSRLVTGLITERGVCPATEEGILVLYPERK